MDMVGILNTLSGTGARIVGTWILVGVVAADFLLSFDGLPGNSVREWLRRVTQRGWLILPGSLAPYILGVLVGHFYHPPGSGISLSMNSPFYLGGWWPLGTVLLIGVLLALVSRFTGYIKNQHLPFLAAFGLLVGAVIWPV